MSDKVIVIGGQKVLLNGSIDKTIQTERNVMTAEIDENNILTLYDNVYKNTTNSSNVHFYKSNFKPNIPEAEIVIVLPNELVLRRKESKGGKKYKKSMKKSNKRRNKSRRYRK